jgi:phosphate transport system permease protein
MATEAPRRPQAQKRSVSFASSPGDSVFVAITVIFASVVIALVLIFAVNLFLSSWESLTKNGLNFYTSINWEIAGDNLNFGALNFIYASLVTSAIALILGGTISVGAAIFLAEYAPPWLRTPIAFMIELLAAIPSIIYGFWGVQVLSPILGGPDGIEAFLSKWLGFLPMFNDKVSNIFGREVDVRFTGRDILTAGLILSIMIIPIVSSITRDVLRTVPDSQREGMLAMGATKWQTITRAVLSYGKGGIIGAVILGLGRAVGETVAVAYLIGGASTVIGPSPVLFVSNETLPAKISNSYGEITRDTQSAIIQLGLTLFVITLIINMIARYLVVRNVQKRSQHKAPTGFALVFSQIGKWSGRLFFPVVMLLLSPYLSLPVSLIVIAIWGLIKFIRFQEVRAATEGKSFPRVLQLIGNPNKSYRYRKTSNNIMTGLVTAAAVVAIIPLASILILVTVNGLPTVFNPGFLTNDQRTQPYGILHAIIGTGIMTGIGALVGIPIGVLAGIYLAEFGRGRFADAVRFTADVLQGIPSIIMGIVVYTMLVQPRFFSDPNLTSPYNGITGGIALGIMIIPIITLNTEEILKLVPLNMREAALALGVPRWRSTVTVIIPAAFSGVMTGIILGVARIAGETAPLLLTARGNTYFPDSLQGQTPSITLYIFLQQKALKPEEVQQLWGAAFVLVFMIMLLTLSMRYLTRNKLGTRLSN